MTLNTFFFIIINIFHHFEISHEIRIDAESLNVLPDYDFSWTKDKENGLRRRFLDKKKGNQDQDYRIKLFENLSKSNIYVDEILHSEISTTNPRLKYFNNYETLYRKFLSMKGVKYVYKRDFFWRTWRVLNNTNHSVVCYKCNSFNSSSAQCGYWVIEEKPPPCPYEIFSLEDSITLCVVNYTGFHNPSQPCPSKIHLEELLETCTNPILTKWRVQRDYSAADQSAIDICQGRENCDITSLYTINKDSIIFRLINSTNHIFYSRVMKSGSKNYACDEDCGYFNPRTQAVTKNNKHLVLNLLNYNPKNKREDVITKNEINNNKINEPLNKSVFKYGLHYIQVSNKQFTDKQPIRANNSKSLCKIIQDAYLDVQENYSDYDF